MNLSKFKRSGNCDTLFAFLAVIAFLIAFPSPGLCQDEADRALALARKTYASLVGLQADFVQTEERPGVGMSSREEGILFFSPPDRMRWDYGGKRPHSVVINNSRVWIHTPSRKQIIVRELTPKEMRMGAATFFSGLDGIEEDFTVQSRVTAPGESVPLDLFPLEDNLPYDKISILVASDSGLVERIAIHHKLGNVTTITFHGIKTGVELSDDLFKWDVPKGTEVIEP
ncbi:MAG: outer membrane lipoprotein carrier protein LolA [bacterium]|nr:outer membrane lipoprotein carrier protein LolA [bacterium]MDT8367389.1 outer membrane lipoprotein carrier protein LolA [bacterium]